MNVKDAKHYLNHYKAIVVFIVASVQLNVRQYKQEQVVADKHRRKKQRNESVDLSIFSQNTKKKSANNVSLSDLGFAFSSLGKVPGL